MSIKGREVGKTDGWMDGLFLIENGGRWQAVGDLQNYLFQLGRGEGQINDSSMESKIQSDLQGKQCLRRQGLNFLSQPHSNLKVQGK